MIVTCPRHFEEEASGEIAEVFARLGFANPRVTTTGISGILTVATGGDGGDDPVEIAGRISAMVLDEPWSVRYSQRIIPIQKDMASRTADIADGIDSLKSVMGDGHTYRITIEKRHSTLSGRDVIKEVAGRISNTVNLDNPDWVVLVEVLGARAGVSVVRPDSIVSVEKVKRSLSEQD